MKRKLKLKYNTWNWNKNWNLIIWENWNLEINVKLKLKNCSKRKSHCLPPVHTHYHQTRHTTNLPNHSDKNMSPTHQSSALLTGPITGAMTCRCTHTHHTFTETIAQTSTNYICLCDDRNNILRNTNNSVFEHHIRQIHKTRKIKKQIRQLTLLAYIPTCQSPSPRNTNSLQHWPSPTMRWPVCHTTHSPQWSSQFVAWPSNVLSIHFLAWGANTYIPRMPIGMWG